MPPVKTLEDAWREIDALNRQLLALKKIVLDLKAVVEGSAT